VQNERELQKPVSRTAWIMNHKNDYLTIVTPIVVSGRVWELPPSSVRRVYGTTESAKCLGQEMVSSAAVSGSGF
jgi:hypothetical protein